MSSSPIESFLRRSEPLQTALIAVAFWTLAVMALACLRYLHLWGMPEVVGVIARAVMACCGILFVLIGIRCLSASSTSGSLTPIWRSLGGTPGVLLFAAVASYLMVGAAVMDEADWQPGTTESVKYAVLCFGVLVAAAMGGRAVLERVGADRLLQGVLVVLTMSCAVILASPILRDLGILAPYRIPFRLTGAFDDPNSAGVAACMTAGLAAAFLTNGGPRALGWLGLAAGVAAGLGTASRTALVVFAAMAAVFLLMNVRSKPKAIVLLAVTVTAGIAGLVGLASSSVVLAEWSRLRHDEWPGETPFYCPSPADSPGTDCAVLLAVRDFLAGDITLNWSRSVPVDRWRGVTVDGPQGRVTALRLRELGLNGRIPPELGRLDRLVLLDLARNRLTGRIPPELGNLASLRNLRLSFNALTGAIPPELVKLENLEELWLRNNRLGGPVPVGLGEIDLSLLRLSGNDFDSIPPQLSIVPNHDLTAWRFCLPPPATSPAFFEDCTALLAAKDTLAGEAPLNWSKDIPVGSWQGVIVSDVAGRVTALDLSGKGLTGRIPPEVVGLEALTSLNLAGNRLTGPVPPELGQLPRLRTLWLRENRLTNPVPPALFQISEHDLGHFVFCGPPPRFNRLNPPLYDDCALLLAAKDTLAGDAPLNWRTALPIGEWQGVTLGGPQGRVIALELPRTGLNGRVPAALGSLTSLQRLVLDGNRLTGPVPPELEKLTNLKVLGLAANALTGSIPLELAKLPSLEDLRLSGNRLTGSMPPELRALVSDDAYCPAAPADSPGLRADCALLLAARDFLAGDAWLNWSAHLPIESWQGITVDASSQRVTALELSSAGLNGRIPPELGRLSQLVTLDLVGNRLTGPVPPELEGLDNLSLLRLAGNDLDRPFPQRLYRIVSHDLDLDDMRLPRSLGNTEAAQTAARPTGGDGLDAVERLFCQPSTGIASELQADCALLLANREFLAGEAPLNWSEEIPIEFWQGVSVGGAPQRVTALELRRAGLNGRLFAELGELSGLVALDLSHNRLAGAIPPELEGLDNLSLLRLAGNDLDRPFPPALDEIVDHDLDTPVFCRPRKIDPGLLADCALLLAAKDALAGNAPLNWSRDVPLDDWLGVVVDRFRGRVKALELTQMGLHGNIPPELGQLDGLAALRLDRNRLAGAIPPELGNLLDLRTLALNGNLLTGTVPPELGKLSRLTVLWLHGNRLIGPAPSAVTALPGLAAFRLDDDEAAGDPPAPDAGRRRVFDRNPLCRSLREALPRLHDDCVALLDARDVLTGDVELNWSDTVPIDYWRGVTLGYSAFDGEAADEPRVIALDLSHTGLNGRIPAALSALDGLAVLRLGDNRLTGAIPPELAALTGLRTLTLENNALTGEIPPELDALQALVSLRLGGNELTGGIPWELTTLTELRVLALENNALVGAVHPEFGNLSHLEELRLDNNRLGGGILAELGRLPRLAVLRLGGNALTSCVPASQLAATTRHDLVEAGLACEPPPWRKPGRFEVGARLMRMRDVLAGDAALNWSYARPVASWDGVAITRHGTLVSLDLRDRNLTGHIPPELGELSHVEMVLLDGNRLTGAIPPELGNLAGLTMLSLGGNRLTGPIPREIADLANLRQLWLADNRLTGAVPLELAKIRELSLTLADNELDASCLPPELHGLRSHDSDDSLLCTFLTTDRLRLWRLGFRKAMEAPVFGHGLRALKYLEGSPISHSGLLQDPHNLYITLLGEAGIVPLLLFLSAILLLLRAQWGAPKSLARDATVAWVIIIALYSMTFSDLLSLEAFMFLAGLSVAMGAAHDSDRRRAKAQPVAGDKLHVGFVLPSLNGGGAERVVLSLAESLIARGHRADLVIPCFAGNYRAAIPRGLRLYRGRLPHTDRTFLREVQRSAGGGAEDANGMRVTALGVNPFTVAWIGLVLARKYPGIRVRRKRSLYASVHTLIRYIRKARPQVLASALPSADAAAVCAAELTERCVPVVVTVHTNVTASYAPEWLETSRMLYPLADAVVAVSRGVAESVQRSLGLDAKRIHAIYNPIPADSIRRLAQEEVTHPWFADDEPPVVLSVGREAPPKDHPTLVEAFGLARREADARLVILGRLSAPYRARLEFLAQRHGVEDDLGFLDFDENPYRYMARAALVALSSRWEGLGIVIVEALACGTPVVSTDAPYGPREILGQWGDLPPVGDAPALAQELVKTLRGEHPPEKALRARAADFSPEKAADAYVALFEKVVSERAP